MKKRFLTLALAIALLVTMIPLGALTVRAESQWVASQDMIDVLKRWEGFSKKPYWDNTQWTVGYGTRVPEGKLEEYMEHGITEEEAEELLQQFLTEMGSEINAFADKYGLSFNQSQFDALLSLSFNCGTGWLYKTSTLRTSVVEGWTGDDLLFSFGQWSNSGGKTVLGLVRRRLAEAQMYLDGVYDVAPKDDYSYVLFNANGGASEIVVQGFDVNAEPEIRAVPTYDDLVFEGWYTDATGGEKVTKLDATLKGYTLYAHWTAGNGEGAPGEEGSDEEITGTPVDYERQVATGSLHAFEQPVKGALVVDAYKENEVLHIVAEYTDSNGVKWGHVEEGGWINLAYTKEFKPGEEIEGPGIEVTVTATDVNLRRGPGTDYAVIGKADKGDVLLITQTANGSGYLWGKSEKGWIALQFTNYDEVISGPKPEEPKPEEPKPEEPKPEEPKPEEPKPEEPKPEEPKPEEPKPEEPNPEVIATGKVKLQSGTLNVRSGAGTGNPVVDRLKNGDPVEIYEIKQLGATKWGRISKGWISLAYVALDNAPEEPKPENPQPENPKPVEPVTGKVFISTGKLNIRSGPGTGYDVIGYLTAGDKVVITEQKTIDGIAWGKIGKGWVSMAYIALDQETGEPVKGTVSANGSKLRVRTGPGSNYSICAYLEDGSEVTILEQRVIDGAKWGRVEQGWVSMTFIKLEGAEPEPEPEKPGTVEGIVTATSLNIRKEPSTSATVVGRLNKGDRVTILEIKEVNGMKWGRISNGWVSMDYIQIVNP